jgi:hypothetical protein
MSGVLLVVLVGQTVTTMPLRALPILTGSRHLEPLPAVLRAFLLAATVHDISTLFARPPPRDVGRQQRTHALGW